jgi:hypothetical protein
VINRKKEIAYLKDVIVSAFTTNRRVNRNGYRTAKHILVSRKYLEKADND